MSQVPINFDHVVSWFMQEDPRFRRLYERVQLDFANENFDYKVCLHEAEHAVLMESDGMQNVRFSGLRFTTTSKRTIVGKETSISLAPWWAWIANVI